MASKFKIASDKKFIISPDHSATETEGPYPSYATLQEFGWTGNKGNAYMRPAVKKTMAQSSTVIAAVISNESFLDGNPADALLKALAKRIQVEAKRKAPVDTGTLKESIFVEEIDSNEKIF